MAEALTPQESREAAERASSREAGPRPEQRAERAPEQRQEGAGEQAGNGAAAAAAAAPAYVPQDADEAEHAELKASPQDQQIEKLKRMVLEEGALKAVFHAKRLGDPYVIDELHDALVDELRTQLFEEGKIEEL